MYALELDELKRHDYRVEPWGQGWMLVDIEAGAGLQVDGIGIVVPRKRDAVAEGLRRIGADAQHDGAMTQLCWDCHEPLTGAGVRVPIYGRAMHEAGIGGHTYVCESCADERDD